MRMPPAQSHRGHSLISSVSDQISRSNVPLVTVDCPVAVVPGEACPVKLKFPAIRDSAGQEVAGLAFGAVQDQAAGYDTEPEEAIAAMDRLIDRLEAHRARPSL